MLKRVLFAIGVLIGTAGVMSAQPDGVVSSSQREGVMVTRRDRPQLFIFRCGNSEVHFDGSTGTIVAEGGFEVGEPIAGLHYLRPRLSVDVTPYSPEDMKLIEAQFHGAATGDFYLFKTVEGQLFILPKEGETPVVRVDYVLKNHRTVTVWMKK